MSNFGFNWVWKEWYVRGTWLHHVRADEVIYRIPDLSLSPYHPRRKFIRRAVELEIRASYYDRIKETLPGDFHTPESLAVPQEGPGPAYEYEDPSE